MFVLTIKKPLTGFAGGSLFFKEIISSSLQSPNLYKLCCWKLEPSQVLERVHTPNLSTIYFPSSESAL